jgi:hypothetical protein
LFNTSADTWSGVLSARDAVMGATPASMATSRKVMAPLLRRERLEGLGSVMEVFDACDLHTEQWYRYHYG